MKLEQSHLENILTGAGFYASGGGGDINLVGKLIERIFSMPNRKPIVLAPSNTVPDTENITVVAMAGDPSKFDPNTLAQYGAQDSVVCLAKNTGKAFNYLMPIEIGANTLIPMLVAAQTGRAVIDGSGTPRSVPRLQDTKLFTHGVPIAPVAFASDQKNSKELFYTPEKIKKEGKDIDSLMREIVSSEPFNGTTGFAGFAMNGAKMKTASSLNTISLAMNLGNELNNLNGRDVFEIIQTQVYAENRKTYKLAEGTIANIEHIQPVSHSRMALNTQQANSSSGFQVLKVTIKANDGSLWVVKAVNENIIVCKDKQPMALGPDLISYVNNKGEVFSNTNITIGQPIMLIGTQASPEMRDPKVVGDFEEVLKSLDYHGNYIPIEQLQSKDI